MARAKAKPEWSFRPCPTCGAVIGQSCLQLVTVMPRSGPGERALHRSDKPHAARLEACA